MNARVTAVIVTYESDAFIDQCVAHLRAQTLAPTEILLVDNASHDTSSLARLSESGGVPVTVVKLPFNIGFAGGCNAADAIRDRDAGYVVYVGPDTFLSPDYLERGVTYLAQPEHSRVGAVSGLLLGYSNQRHEPTGLIDSAGINQTWYGRWFDRDQRRPVKASYSYDEPEALCATAMLCRAEALAALSSDGVGGPYDTSFFMYKEDIDLSLRLRDRGYGLHLIVDASAYHCRGWTRSKMSRRAKILSARNEATINARRGIIPFLFSCAKLFVVSRGFF